MIRKATEADIDAVASIYAHSHSAEEEGKAVIGWIRGVYPERQTALPEQQPPLPLAADWLLHIPAPEQRQASQPAPAAADARVSAPAR